MQLERRSDLTVAFSRALRVMRHAAQSLVGEVPSAVMLHAQLRQGMKLLEIAKLTRSLGRKAGDEPETFAWRDASGAQVRVEFKDGRYTPRQLERPQA